jgi:hypothetical protein
MSTTVPVSFIEQYEAEVKQVYQREGSLLRNAIRTRTQINAERVYFPILGKGMATSKARHADVNPMDLEHTRVFADMADFYAPEYIDELDQAKLNWSLASEYARASGNALGRQTDAVIIDAMNATTNVLEADDSTLGNTDGILDLQLTANISKLLNAADVPMDTNRYAVVDPQTHAELLQLSEATSSDFTTSQLLMNAREPAMWMGFRWIMHTGLPEGVKGFFFHSQAAGHGISRDIVTEVNYVPQKVAWLVNSYMSMGATIIEEAGVLRLDAKD